MPSYNNGTKYSQNLYAKTKKYQKIYGFELGKGSQDTWNNEADAFKHTFGSAELSLVYTTNISKIIADIHEYDGHFRNGQPLEKENMDRWNNFEGRKIAEEIRKDYSKDSIKLLIQTGQIRDLYYLSALAP